MTSTWPRRIGMVVAAIVVFEVLGSLVAGLGTGNLGYDFEAYRAAASRTLAGAPLYDVGVNIAGAFAIYLYPPPFALAFIPFALVPHQVGLWQWEAIAIGALIVAIAILPVSARVRWIVLGLSVISWPVIYSIILGQVGTLLLLIFAIGWRWRDNPIALGLSMATGALIKVQPVLLLAWAGATGRWRSVVIALTSLLVAAAVATIVFGPAVWADYVALLGRVNSSVTTPNGYSVGAILYQAGVAEGTARIVQYAVTAGVIAVVVLALITASDEVSYLTTVVGSQVLSPLVWDHYAVVLILPTAWLLERRLWWALAIMLVTALPIIFFLPPAIYPILFGVGLVGPLAAEAVERRRNRRDSTTASVTAATA